METTQRNAMMAQQKITVTYTVEEVIKSAEVYDKILSNLARDVAEGETDKGLLDDALVLNMFLGRMRQSVYDTILGK